MHDEVKSISRDKDHIQSTIAKMHKKEEKVKHELESNTLRMKEAEGELKNFIEPAMVCHLAVLI